jgi:hypothetical protein
MIYPKVRFSKNDAPNSLSAGLPVLKLQYAGFRFYSGTVALVLHKRADSQKPPHIDHEYWPRNNHLKAREASIWQAVSTSSI